MAREFKELASLRTNLEKYTSNWEHIFGKKEVPEGEGNSSGEPPKSTIKQCSATKVVRNSEESDASL
jgi:hypothetical protein